MSVYLFTFASTPLGAMPLAWLADYTGAPFAEMGLSLAQTQTTPPPPVLESPSLPTAQSGYETVVSQPRYVIDAKMDYDAKTMEVHQQIDYPNASGEKLNEIVLAICPNSIQDVFNLKNVIVNDTETTDYTLDGQKLTVKLPTPLENGQASQLVFDYTLTLPKIEQGDPNVIRPQIFGVTARQVNEPGFYNYVPGATGRWWCCATVV